MTANAPIQLPDTPVSASDLVGKALRIARINWRVIVLPFLLPSFFYNLAQYILSWAPELQASGYPTTAVSAIVAASIMVEVITRFVICIKTFAVQRMLLYIQPALNLRLSVRESAIACFIGSPIAILDLFLIAVMVAAIWMITIATSQADFDEYQAYFGFGILSFLFLLLMPFIAVTALHSFFTANFIAERMSLSTSIKRFLRFLRQNPGFFLQYMMIAGCVYFTIQTATSVSEIIFAMIIEMFKSPTKDVVTILAYTLDSILMAPVFAIWYAGIAVTGACVQNQLTMALEGSDLRRRLQQLTQG